MIESLQGRIRDLFSASGCNPRLVSDYNLYSASVIQKLWSAQYYLSKLRSLDIRKYWEEPTVSYTHTQLADSYSVATQEQGLKLRLYSCDVHLLLDGFFFQSMSTLDTLAHEIWSLYDFHGQQKPSRLYIGRIGRKLTDVHPNSALGKFLKKQLGQDWFDEFGRFRHCTTHESLIVYDDVQFRYDSITNEVTGSVITLPDDPKARPPRYKKKREATKYCTDILGRIQSLVEKSHEKILLDIRRNNNVFPISRP